MKLSNSNNSFGNRKKFGLKKNDKKMPRAYYLIFAGVILAVFLVVCFLPFDLEGKTAAFFLAFPFLAIGGVAVFNVITKKRK